MSHKEKKVEPYNKKIMDQTKDNINMGQLLEITPYCKKKILETIMKRDKVEELLTHISLSFLNYY